MGHMARNQAFSANGVEYWQVIRIQATNDSQSSDPIEPAHTYDPHHFHAMHTCPTIPAGFSAILLLGPSPWSLTGWAARSRSSGTLSAQSLPQCGPKSHSGATTRHALATTEKWSPHHLHTHPDTHPRKSPCPRSLRVARTQGQSAVATLHLKKPLTSPCLERHHQCH